MSTDVLPLELRRQRLDRLLKALSLVRDPFPVTPDFESYFFSPRLQVRYEELLSAVAWRKGFVLVTGDVGVGKTTLARLLITTMQGQGVRSALVINTFVQGAELLRVINRDFGLAGAADTIEGLLDELHGFLLEQYAAGANCVLLIDDAQALTVNSLELLRQLSNLETSRHKLLQLVLVGQPELLDLLGRGDLRQLRSRIAMHLRIEPMTLAEMDAYIYHRLAAAGNGAALKVDAAALTLLWEASAGYPRRVHLVMDRCLFGALGRQLTRIDRSLMREAIAEVELPAGSAAPKRPARPTVAGVGGGRAARWAVGALFALVAVVAAVQLEVVPRAALDPLLKRSQAYLERGLGALAATPDHGDERARAGGAEARDLAADAAAPVVTSAAAAPRSAGEGTPPLAAASAELTASTAPASAPQSIFATIPEPLWRSFWARFGTGQPWQSMPAAAALPDDRGAALAALDAALQGTGLRTFLFDRDRAVCDEHVALRFLLNPAGPEHLLVLASAPPSPALIEFGRHSETVRWAQERLRVRGALRAEHVDALLGPVTVYALAHFQREAGLPATGQLDDASLYRLSCAGTRVASGAARTLERAP
ncbi:hypothetical protein TMEC54S_03356 [Thauera mechernichensis]